MLLPWGKESVYCPEDGGRKFAQHVDVFISNYTASLLTSCCCEDLKPHNKMSLTLPCPSIFSSDGRAIDVDFMGLAVDNIPFNNFQYLYS
jgi:hypothetical protein